jgi:2-iminoacetate synthase
MYMHEPLRFIDEDAIVRVLAAPASKDAGQVRAALAKARGLAGLEVQDVATLAAVSDPELLGEIFQTARAVKDQIYGPRLVLFAPLYVSNLCANDCVPIAPFRARNKEVKRRALSQDEIRREVEILVDQGHKRILLVAGESYPQQGFQYVLDSIATIYSVKRGKGEIRRVNANVAPLTVDEFRALKGAGIGTYQLFQETYHHATYQSVHLAGKKRDYDWRVSAMDRAMEAGIDDVGIGILFGLADWRFEILALMQHIRHLEARSAWARTPSACRGWSRPSVPRLPRPRRTRYPTSTSARSSPFCAWRCLTPASSCPRARRPTSGARPSPWEYRRSRPAAAPIRVATPRRGQPGGASQFQLGDHRDLDEVMRDVASMGYVPSFCTGCYRLGRTGHDFMDLAKPGAIKLHCDPNALSTFDRVPGGLRQSRDAQGGRGPGGEHAGQYGRAPEGNFGGAGAQGEGRKARRLRVRLNYAK